MSYNLKPDRARHNITTTEYAVDHEIVQKKLTIGRNEMSIECTVNKAPRNRTVLLFMQLVFQINYFIHKLYGTSFLLRVCVCVIR